MAKQMRRSDRQDSHQCGQIRVQALSPTLVRLEIKGPKGFEGRPTFHVVERTWPGTQLQREESLSGVTLRAQHWSVWLPPNAQNLQDCRITDAHGALLYTCSDAPTSARELPAPGDRPRAWAMGDRPRLIPPIWGATPAPPSSQPSSTSGWDLGNDAQDIYVFLPQGDYGRLRAEVLKLTGQGEMPPLYLFGGFHSRYFPYTDQGALAMIRSYRERRFPLDVFMVDTDWRVGGSFGYEINLRCFPDFQGFLRQVHQMGVHIGLNDHPKAMTTNALDPLEMEYRYENLARFLWMGVDFWWFDRNWDVSLTGPLPVLCKEVWGMRVFRDMSWKAMPERRPLILANVDGIDDGIFMWPPDIASHRYPFQWTGDTLLGWEELRRGVENALRAGVHSLIPYISEDVGAHEGMPSAEFYLRHWQFAVLSAVVRPHASRSLYFQREPWTFGPDVENLTREYLLMRYRLLPHFYAAARCHFDTGVPLLRRLDLLSPDQPEATANDQYLLGDGLLVAPIMEGEGCNPTLPAAWLKTPEGAPGILLELFPNENLLGTPMTRRVEAQVDAQWSAVSHHQPFSARWTGKLTPTRPVQIGMFMEQGGRLFLDGQPLFDHWIQDQWIHSHCNHGLNLMTLEPDQTYDLRLESRHGPGEARCQLFFRPMDLPSQPVARSVWLPDGDWIDLWTGVRASGPRTIQVQAPAQVIPMFVRAGSLFILAPPMQHTGEKPWDPITLDVYPHARRIARGELYEDDRCSNAYLNGAFRRTSVTVRLDALNKQVVLHIGEALGTFPGAPAERSWVLQVHRPPELQKVQRVLIDGQESQDWGSRPMGPAPTPFQVQGPALDAEVIEVALPSRPVSHGRRAVLEFY